MKFEYESENLIYRILTEDYAPEVLDFYSRNELIFDRFEPEKGDKFLTLPYQESLLRLEYNQFLMSNGGRFWVFEKKTPDRICGCVSFNNIIRGCFCQARIGYKVDTARHQLGIGTEAVTFCSDIMLVEGGIHRIEAYIHPDNTPSVRLAEKCGFFHEGTAYSFASLQDGWTDLERYVKIGDR